MVYSVKELSELSGVSPRALRYYDQIGLLCPVRGENGYRIYGEAQVDRLQQILFYHELELPLAEMKSILCAPDYDRKKALEAHLRLLTQKEKRIKTLVATVKKTIQALTEEKEMCNSEKFEGFRQELLAENERKYGNEIRAKYGASEVEASYAKIRGMSEEAWVQAEKLGQEIGKTLQDAVRTEKPGGEKGKMLCMLHRKWLCMFWGEGRYSPEAHRSLAESYLCDERLKAYYDGFIENGAQFLHDAILAHVSA